ncbi:MAG TPA: ATP-binding protein [Anaeromyxobacteraceae bacterium]|nr:ATP-binding protein [Anaeromyxobacteraceae bacterium]
MFLTFAVALSAFVLVALFAVGRMHAVGNDLRLLSEEYLPLTRLAAQIEVKDWVTARALEVRAMDPAARRAFLRIARAHFPGVVKERLSEARAVAESARGVASGQDARFLLEVSARLEGLDARWAAYDQAVRALFDALEHSGGADAPALAERAEVVRRLEKGLSLDVKLLQAALEGQVASHLRVAERAERKSALLAIIYSLIAAAVGLVAILIGQRLLAPVRTLTEGVKAVAAGDLSRKVDVRSKDELGLLAREFNAMAASLNRQRSELLRAERLAAVGRISAQITHEIRNPLNAIGLNTELLAEEVAKLDLFDRNTDEARRPRGGPQAHAELRSLVQAIGREVDRLNAVAEEYLRFARLPRPIFVREDLNELLRGLAEFVRPELAAANVELHLELASELLLVRVDEGQLRAAFLNLLRNSQEAMPHGGAVELATQLAGGGSVEAMVRDTGGGIPAEALPRIFDPFYSTKEKGTGLGLAFAQQVVQEHGGLIRCESTLGGGAVFTVRLPQAGEELACEKRAPARSGIGEALGA